MISLELTAVEVYLLVKYMTFEFCEFHSELVNRFRGSITMWTKIIIIMTKGTYNIL